VWALSDGRLKLPPRNSDACFGETDQLTILDVDPINSGGNRRYTLSSMLVGDHSGECIEVHEQGAEAYLTARVRIGIEEPWILSKRQNLEPR
jgi:hypothetical protein